MYRPPTNKPRAAQPFTRIVHLVDGTYELFRHFYGLRRFNKGVDRPYGAVVGVLQTVLQMIENGDRVKGCASRGLTYLGVATDHVIESFRNLLWADYRTCFAGGRCGGRLPRDPWDRRQDRRPAFEPVRPDRTLPVKHSRRTARSRAALQEARDAAHRCAALRHCRDAALARCDVGIRGLGGSDGSAAATRALRKGCEPMTMRLTQPPL